MIVCPPGWHIERGEDRATLVPPEGRACGEVGYRRRVRPLRPARTVAAELIAQRPQLTAVTLSEPEMLLTAEGEYAAILVASGRRGDQLVQLAIGVVFGDQHMSTLIAEIARPEYADYLTDAVRYFVYHEALKLGLRKRRFLYDPPTGWQGLPSGLLTNWYPLDFPKNPVTLAVHPATPTDGPPESVFAALLARYKQKNFQLEAQYGPELVTSDHGLHGKAWCIVGTIPGRERLVRDLLVFADSRYLYALLLESTPAADRAAQQALLPRVARSVRPIPPPLFATAAARKTSFSHWAF